MLMVVMVVHVVVVFGVATAQLRQQQQA